MKNLSDTKWNRVVARYIEALPDSITHRLAALDDLLGVLPAKASALKKILALRDSLVQHELQRREIQTEFALFPNDSDAQPPTKGNGETQP